MKNLSSIILFTFIMVEAFPQLSENRFENRKKEGYYNITQMGLLMGNRKLSDQNSYYYYNPNNNVQVTPSVTMINGVMSAEGWGVGIGAGFEIFEHNLFPVFIDFRHVLRDDDVSLFFAFKTGYSIGNLSKKTYDNVYFRNFGGLMVNPEMGIKIPLNEKADLLFTVAYRYQKMKTTFTQRFNNYENEYNTSMNRMAFGVAIMFR